MYAIKTPKASFEVEECPVQIGRDGKPHLRFANGHTLLATPEVTVNGVPVRTATTEKDGTVNEDWTPGWQSKAAAVAPPKAPPAAEKTGAKKQTPRRTSVGQG